jgi:hypothetical protein
MTATTDFTSTPNPLATDPATAKSVYSALLGAVRLSVIAYLADSQAVISFIAATQRSLADAVARTDGVDDVAAWYVLAWEMANTVRTLVEEDGNVLHPTRPPEECECDTDHATDTERINGFMDLAVAGDYQAALKHVQAAQLDTSAITPLEELMTHPQDLQVREVGVLLLKVSMHLTANLLLWAREDSEAQLAAEQAEAEAMDPGPEGHEIPADPE